MLDGILEILPSLEQVTLEAPPTAVNEDERLLANVAKTLESAPFERVHEWNKRQPSVVPCPPARNSVSLQTSVCCEWVVVL